MTIVPKQFLTVKGVTKLSNYVLLKTNMVLFIFHRWKVKVESKLISLRLIISSFSSSTNGLLLFWNLCVQSYSLPITESSRTFAIKDITTCSSWCTIWKPTKKLYIINRKQRLINYSIPNWLGNVCTSSLHQLIDFKPANSYVFPVSNQQHNRG